MHPACIDCALNQRCHPEAGALCPTKDLGEPRESPAHFAGEQVARLARNHSMTQSQNHPITKFPKEFHAEK
jgi:hypothetical protein